MNPIKEIAKSLVACGYATDLKEVPYGLTKQKTYAVIVKDEVEPINPYGCAAYSAAQLQALTAADDLRNLLTKLTEDERMHFNKIHMPIENMKVAGLLAAIDLVERSLKNRGVDNV